jgi:hypothetical protein
MARGPPSTRSSCEPAFSLAQDGASRICPGRDPGARRASRDVRVDASHARDRNRETRACKLTNSKWVVSGSQADQGLAPWRPRESGRARGPRILSIPARRASVSAGRDERRIPALTPAGRATGPIVTAEGAAAARAGLAAVMGAATSPLWRIRRRRAWLRWHRPDQQANYDQHRCDMSEHGQTPTDHATTVFGLHGFGAVRDATARRSRGPPGSVPAVATGR